MDYMAFLAINHLRQKIRTFKVKKQEKILDSKGQSFIEFLFLLLILMGLSISLIAGMNTTVSKQWSALVNAIALPNDTDDFQL